MDGIYPINYGATVYYSVVFVVGFVCGISRTLRNGEYSGVGNCLSIGLFGACMASTSVLVLAGNPDDFTDRSFFYIGVAGFIGLSGKEGLAIIQYGMTKIMRMLGIEPDNEQRKQ